MPSVITPIGNTVVLNPLGGTTANVANVATRTNTFHVVNLSPTANVYVGIFPTYAQAIAMDHPSIGTDGGGIPLTGGESMLLGGNFGTTSSTDTVYVAAITAVNGAAVLATPVANSQ